MSSSVENIEASGIYTDLMRKFRDENHDVYIIFPRERRLQLSTQFKIENHINLLGVKTLNVTKTNIIEKGIGQVLLESQFNYAFRKYLNDICFDLILYSTPPVTFTRIIKYVKNVLIFTLAVEGAGAVLLFTEFIGDYPLWKAVFFSIFHSVSAFCNAGFDIMGGGVSLMGYTSSPVVNLTVSALIIIGGIGFTVAMDVINTKRFRRLQFNSKIVLATTAVLLILGFVIIFPAEYNNKATMADMNFGEKILTSVFASVTPRTAGFFSIDYSAVTPITYITTLILMLIGGSPGSTAGGIKTSVVAIIIIAVWRTVKGQDDLNAFGRRIPERTLRKAFVMAFLPLVWIVPVVCVIVITHDLALHDVVFETVSAIATVGLSTGITAELNVIGKILIAMSMFFGRVGLMTVAYAIAKKREDVSKDAVSYRYPEGNIML